MIGDREIRRERDIKKGRGTGIQTQSRTETYRNGGRKIDIATYRQTQTQRQRQKQEQSE